MGVKPSFKLGNLGLCKLCMFYCSWRKYIKSRLKFYLFFFLLCHIRFLSLRHRVSITKFDTGLQALKI